MRRGLQALSRRYVAPRPTASGAPLGRGALDGRGKRAAFALFYAPLHYLVVRRVVAALGLDAPPLERIVDLGCGTGSAGAAWARGSRARPRLLGIETNAWAAAEARFGWRTLGLEGRVEVRDALAVRLPGARAGIALGYLVNEIDPPRRDVLLAKLLDAARAGAAVLVVEPIARPLTRAWWDPWAEAFTRASGRSDEWRFPVVLPELLARLDRAARLDHRELTARTLCLPGRP